jgi:hypothetical protein
MRPRDYSTTAADERMIEAWTACHLRFEDAEHARAERLAAGLALVRATMALEFPPSDLDSGRARLEE